jgi:excisionase family DNA binding protein
MHNVVLSPIDTDTLIERTALRSALKTLELFKKELKADPPQPTEYLTRQELKDLLKVDLSTIHNWTKRGKINAYGIGNRVYFKRSEVDAMLVKIN